MFYKTFYKHDTEGGSGGFSDTKFRRETSNFKINFSLEAYIPDPNSENPTEPIQGLLQILPKNLAPEDFIGAILILHRGNRRTIEALTRVGQKSAGALVFDTGLIYDPSTGYLVDESYKFAGDDEGSEGGGGNL